MHHAMDVCGFPHTKDRNFLQFVGTEWARSKDPDVWINHMEKRIENANKEDHIIITDLRFPNEAEMLKRIGFKLVRVEFPRVNDQYISQTQSSHSSETALDNYTHWDAIVFNNGTDDYRRSLIQMLNSSKLN
jgi:hypothetical protein